MHVVVSLLVDGLVFSFEYIRLGTFFLHFVEIKRIGLLPGVLFRCFKLTLRDYSRFFDIAFLLLPSVNSCLSNRSSLCLSSIIFYDLYFVLRAVKAGPLKLGQISPSNGWLHVLELVLETD